MGFGQEGVAPGAEGKVDVRTIHPHWVDVEAAGVHCLVFKDAQPVPVDFF